jgi:hypothetical protein
VSKQPQPQPEPEVAQIVSKALTAVVTAKTLQMKLVKLMTDYAKTQNRDNILITIDYFKDLNAIVSQARELRAELLTYLMFIVSKGIPLTLKEDVLTAFSILNSVNFDQPESLITTVLSDTFINKYMGILLSVQAVGVGAGATQPIVLQIPVQPTTQPAGGVRP